MVNSRFKFRAWDKNRKKMWSHSDLYKMDCSNEYPFLALIRGFYATNMFPGEEMDVIPMQFTGLKDKNGKEVYEGDIVETVTASGNPFGTIDVVRYQDGGFKLVDDTDSLLPIYIGDDKEVISIEVIGNIYENPELLEGSEKNDSSENIR